MGIANYPWAVALMPRGEKNLITDVPGVLVGQVTLSGNGAETGVTAILPHAGNLFRSKVPAAAHTINGFGKSAGLIQIQELGNIETPIVMTNTFGVGTAVNGVVTHMLEQNEEIGDTTGTVNSVVMECNDGEINQIRSRFVTEEHVLQAIAQAGTDFEEGAVGSGRGMICYGLKGGIGSASRIVELDGCTYTVGALLMTNFGQTKNLRVYGEAVGQRILEGANEEDKGSVIVVLATDAPLSPRQMGRCARRAQNGLARTGSHTGNGSGEIVLMFSTANQISHKPESVCVDQQVLHEEYLNPFFQAVTECVEESVVSSMMHAEAVKNRRGRTIHSLAEYM